MQIKNKIITINEMILRDGLQSLKNIYTYDTRFKIYKLITETGISNIEFCSTTSSKILPQMSNCFELFSLIKEYNKTQSDNSISNIILCTSTNGLINSINKNIQEVSLILSVSDEFSLRNLKKTSVQTLSSVFEQIEILSKNFDKINKVRIYISCVFGSVFEDFNSDYINSLLEIMYKLVNFTKITGVYDKIEFVLSDTYGLAGILYNLSPSKTRLQYILEEIKKIIQNEFSIKTSIHLHTDQDFYWLIDICLNNSIRSFDSSILGIGGCPFSDCVLKGNISTVKLVKYLYELDYQTNINLEKLELVEQEIKHILEKDKLNV